jgi:DNA invertase Pin-like site-specific DNA recombinase
MRYVIYKRLSKESKNGNNLGLEAQQAAVSCFLKNQDHVIVSSYEEIETGTKKGNSRPALKQALLDCKNYKATLLIARIDRLARNVHFLSGLMESGINFIAVDNPYMTKFNAQILACVAELEAEMISKRTKAALQVLKDQGKKLGTPANLTKEASAKGLTVANGNKKLKAEQYASSIAPTLLQLKLQKFTLSKMAQYLNEKEVATASGRVGVWQANKVQKCFVRLEGMHAN